MLLWSKRLSAIWDMQIDVSCKRCSWNHWLKASLKWSNTLLRTTRSCHRRHRTGCSSKCTMKCFWSNSHNCKSCRKTKCAFLRSFSRSEAKLRTASRLRITRRRPITFQVSLAHLPKKFISLDSTLPRAINHSVATTNLPRNKTKN